MTEMTERTQEAQFTITRVFDAPRELVWRAWTESADATTPRHPPTGSTRARPARGVRRRRG